MRSLRRTPGFFVTGVGSLGIALAVCTLTFAALEAVVHPYVPVSGSDASVHHPRPRLGTQGTVSSAEQYTQLREGTEFYSSIAYAAGSPAIVSGPAGSEDVWTEMKVATSSPSSAFGRPWVDSATCKTTIQPGPS